MSVIPPNSILYTCIASVGKMSYSFDECATNQQINSVIPNSDHVSLYFFYSLQFMTPRIKKLSANTTLPIINKTEFSGIKIQLPHPDEQKKIADALSSMDFKINAVSDQLAGLETFKKGLLQQMFV